MFVLALLFSSLSVAAHKTTAPGKNVQIYFIISDQKIVYAIYRETANGANDLLLEKYVVRGDFATFVVNSRSNATKNPRATMQKPITVEDYLNSRMIAEPYHLLDCCLETDVGCAMIITSAERARDFRKTPVFISAGVG